MLTASETPATVQEPNPSPPPPVPVVPQGLTPPVLPGYSIDGPIAGGGMGMVWAGRQDALHRRVAIKIMRADLARDPQYVERFQREARAAARLSHPGIVAVHDAGFHDGQLFLTMELVEGGDLRRRLAQGPLAEPIAVELLLQIAEAVTAIHRAGLVHRDLKPENILLGLDGRPKIADLGLARAPQGDDRMTATGLAIGTPSYMAPEQATGAADLDERCDVYGLGATGYALLTGRPPYQGSTAWETVHLVISAPPPDPRRLVPGLSAGTAAVLRRALAKRPQDRHASAAAFARDLRQQAGKGALAQRWRALLGHGQGGVRTLGRGLARWRAWPLPWRILSAYLTAVALIVLITGVWMLLAGAGAPRTTTRTHHGRAEVRTAWHAVVGSIPGTESAILPGTVEDADHAVLTVLTDRGWIQGPRLMADDEAMEEGRLPSGDRCSVHLERVDDGHVRLTVRIGLLGDKAQERAILDAVQGQ